MSKDYTFADFNKDKEIVRKNAEDCQSIVQGTQTSIDQLQDIKVRAKSSGETYSLLYNFYSEYDEDDFDYLSNADLEPLQNGAQQREYIKQWKNKSQQISNNVANFQDFGVGASATTSLTGIALVSNVTLEGSVISQRQNELIESYKQSIDFKNDIEYIRKCLKEEFPDFLNDFNRLVTIYKSSDPDDTKYMEIMAGRSAFFYKLFGSEGKAHGASSSNKPEQVKCFVVGDESNYIPEVEQLKQDAKTLWEKISSEDSNSAKKGTVDAENLKLIFGELIELVAKVLSLRKLYHKH